MSPKVTRFWRVEVYINLLGATLKKGVDIGGFFQYLGNGIFSFFPKWLVKVDIQVVRI